MQFFTEERFVFLFISALAFCAVFYAYSSKHELAPFIGILFISHGMFAYSVVPFIGAGENKLHWFVTPPPASVSRITVIALLGICAIAIWRARTRIIKLAPGRRLSLAAVLTTLLLAAVLLQVMLQQTSSELGLSIKFALVFSLFCFVAVSVATTCPSCQTKRETGYIFLAATLLIGATTIVAFLEVACDVGPVKNMMRGSVELRASSTFHNPNWFALAVAPCIFIACKVASEGRAYAATGLFGLCALAFILSGSRSAAVLAMMAIAVLVIALRRADFTQSRALGAIIRAGIFGGFGGSLAGFVASLGFGGNAPAYYLALIDRMFAWPIHFILADDQTWHSVRGRITSELPGSSVVDNAYIYSFQANTLVGLLFILLMIGVFIVALRNYLRSRTFDQALRLAIATFVVGSGMAGQVYWAFPVWPIFALMLGYVLQPLAREWLGTL